MPPPSASAIAVEPAVAGNSADQRIRLLILTDTSVLASGGSERFLRNLSARLSPDRYQVTLVQLTRPTRAWCDIDPTGCMRHIQLRTLPTGAVYAPRGWLALRRLRQLVRDGDFDIVQSQHEKSDLFNALLPHRPGAVHISNRRDMGFNKSRRLQWAFQLLNHRFDCIVAPSQPILGWLARRERTSLGRMQWIPNGVDTARFRPLPVAERAAARQASGFDVDAVVFGCIASLTPVKCHDVLLQAFATVHRQLPQARLLLVGDGPLHEPLQQQIAALGLQSAVRLLGVHARVEQLLPVLDIAVLASSTEGMSNAVLESMASGLPVVATAVGGNVQLVDDKITGLLVPARDPEAMAQALLALGRDAVGRRRMGAAARARIEREFSLDAMVIAFDRLYHRLLGRT